MSKTLIELFNLGMMRHYADIIPDVTSGIVLNLGAGNKRIPGTVELELPMWDAERDAIPYGENTVTMIHAYHFLEHIKNVPYVMSEIERVLIPCGHVNIVVPYYSSAMQAQDLDHKSAFTEKTFHHLFNSEYYNTGKVKKMGIFTNLIMGDCEANLCLIVQLVKMP